MSSRAYAAGCVAPSTDYGTSTSTVSIPSTATYRVWSRMQVPDSTNNTYLIDIDGTNCFNVGGGTGIPAAAWTWVSYHDGSTTARTDLSLTQGTHTLKFIGNKPGVRLDRVIFASDLGCTPIDTTGSACNTPADTTAPTVTLTTPASGSTISGSVTIAANASDNTGVTKVEFYVDSTLVGTDTSTPYSASWDSKTTTSDLHRLTAKAYDAAGNVGSASYTVNVQNGDVKAPTTPTGLAATATAYNAVKLQWTASTDNVGVTGYSIIRNGVPVATVGAVTSYNDTGLNASTTYQYQVAAVDAAGNKSAASSVVSVKTPSTPDTKAPTTPTNLSAVSASDSQINLSWTASTDNVGVAAYDVYRSTGTGTAQKIASVTTTSYGDANLAADSTYSYYVIARDSAGNVSGNSNTVQAKTQPTTPPTTDPQPVYSSISGKISSSKTGKAIPWSYVTVTQGVVRRNHIYQADSHGNYYMKRLPIGTYTLRYKAGGYYAHNETVNLTKSPLTKNVSLDKR